MKSRFSFGGLGLGLVLAFVGCSSKVDIGDKDDNIDAGTGGDGQGGDDGAGGDGQVNPSTGGYNQGGNGTGGKCCNATGGRAAGGASTGGTWGGAGDGSTGGWYGYGGASPSGGAGYWDTGGSPSSGGSGTGGNPSSPVAPVVCLEDPGVPQLDAGGPDSCECTRRVTNASPDCPHGANQSSAWEATPENGVIIQVLGTPSTLGPPAELVIPPEAVDEQISVSMTESSCGPPTTHDDWSPVYVISPVGLTLKKPATLRIPYATKDGLVDPSIALYFSTGEGYEKLADSKRKVGFVEGTVTSGGYAFVGVARSGPQLFCP